MSDSEIGRVKSLVDSADHIVILQADNPDGDSLGSALGLEAILGELGKQTSIYCSVDMPSYLRYLSGWDRVSADLPKRFDLSIIVDASTLTLFEKLRASGQQGWVAAKPCVVLDHHASVENVIPFASVLVNRLDVSSSGELIYDIARQAGWNVPKAAMEYLMTAILSDTQGLSNSLATAKTYQVMAEFIAAGVDRPAIEERRRQAGKMTETIFRYKGELIKRVQFEPDDKLAHVTIPQTEITAYSPLYNPAPLIQADMLQTADVGVAIVFKHYADGRITGAIRCNPGYAIGAELAAAFGGGGHPFASGFKITDGTPFDEVRTNVLQTAARLIAKKESHEAV